jgi:excisionase family DNA binding protein
MTSKILLSVDEVIAAIGLGRTSVYALFKSGSLKTIKIGRRTFVRPHDLETFLSKCANPG